MLTRNTIRPIAYRWRSIKKDATHSKYFADLTDLRPKVDNSLQKLATLHEKGFGFIGCCCQSLGPVAQPIPDTLSELRPQGAESDRKRMRTQPPEAPPASVGAADTSGGLVYSWQ